MHPKAGRYLGPGCYLGPMDEFSRVSGYQHGMFYTKKPTCTCMHAIQDVRPYEYTQPLGVNTDVGDYTGQTCSHAVPGRVHGGWALLRMGVISGFCGTIL